MKKLEELSNEQTITLLVIYDISAGDFNAEIPFSEIEKYMEENRDSLQKRVDEGRLKRSQFKEKDEE